MLEIKFKNKTLPVLMTKFVNGSSQSIEMKKIAASEFKAGVFKTQLDIQVLSLNRIATESPYESFLLGITAKNYDSVAMAINRYISKVKPAR